MLHGIFTNHVHCFLAKASRMIFRSSKHQLFSSRLPIHHWQCSLMASRHSYTWIKQEIILHYYACIKSSKSHKTWDNHEYQWNNPKPTPIVQLVRPLGWLVWLYAIHQSDRHTLPGLIGSTQKQTTTSPIIHQIPTPIWIACQLFITKYIKHDHLLIHI